MRQFIILLIACNLVGCGRAHWVEQSTHPDSGVQYGIVRAKEGPLLTKRLKNATEKINQYCGDPRGFKLIGKRFEASYAPPVYLPTPNGLQIPVGGGHQKYVYLYFYCTDQTDDASLTTWGE